MTTTAWAHVPNAAHIDRVLASLEKNPEKWSAAGGAVWNAAQYAARGAVRDAILALVAWDDCAYMLELPENALKVLRSEGNEQAILLSAAAHALKEIS